MRTTFHMLRGAWRDWSARPLSWRAREAFLAALGGVGVLAIAFMIFLIIMIFVSAAEGH